MKMYKRPLHIILFFALVACFSSCENERLYESFYPEDYFTIAEYMEAGKDSLGIYYQLVEELDLLQSLSAYNPYGNSYTLFLPDDNAFMKFFESSDAYSSLEDLLANPEYASILARYHIVNSALETNDFPFGSLPDTTATGDFLTVAIDTASLQPLINGEASILIPNIEMINGYIHIIDKVLEPVTFPLSEWITERDNFSIMQQVFVVTGLMNTLSGDGAYTLLLETDDVLRKQGYDAFEDLVEAFSPDRDDYTDPSNGLYRFAAYHILEGIYYLDDFEGTTANYNTMTVYPVRINGETLELKINPGVTVFDTIVEGQDTTLIDYIGLNYERSNNQAMNGAVHLVDQTVELFLPGRSEVINQFHNEPAINTIRNDAGVTEFSESELFEVIHWTGADKLTYVKSGEQINGVWNNDYIILEGSFTMTYTIPKLLPGKYNFYMNAHARDDKNASVNVFLDGIPLGGNLDLSSGGTSSNPYFNFLIGTVDLEEYAEHTIKVSTVIPGEFKCDRFTFQPVK